jgi:hypothetical protein
MASASFDVKSRDDPNTFISPAEDAGRTGLSSLSKPIGCGLMASAFLLKAAAFCVEAVPKRLHLGGDEGTERERLDDSAGTPREA